MLNKNKKRSYQEYIYYDSNAPIPARTRRYWKSKQQHNIDLRNKHKLKNQINSEELNKENMEKYKMNELFCGLSTDHENININSNNDELNLNNNTSIITNEREESFDAERINVEDTENITELISNEELVDTEEVNTEDITENTENIENPHSSSLLKKSKSYSLNTLVRILLVMATKLRHSLSYVASENIIKLINILSDNEEHIFSKYQIKNILNIYSMNITIHHFCEKCDCYVGFKKEIDLKDSKSQYLHCNTCNLNVDVKKNIANGNFFIYISLEKQLIELLETIDSHVLYSEQRKKHNKYAIEDIYDGLLYKKSITNDTISVNINIDGVPIFDSSGASILPILATINELAPKERRNNVMLLSIWFGKGKPNINEYLKPFIIEAKKLYTHGFKFVHRDIEYTKKCRVLICICDSVARPMVRNSTQFNGQYGCGLCLHPGKIVEKGRGSVNVYPLLNYDTYGEKLRTHNETMIHALNKEKGIKNRSALCDIPEFDIINNLPPDSMHCVYLGVCRQFTGLWFDSKNKDKDFYFAHYLSKIDKIMLSYKPSLEISRTPRKILDRQYWKAHEWLIFLLFYSIPTFKKVFPSVYLKHWSLLIESISILSKTSIMISEIYNVQAYLFQFVKGVEELYGIENCSFNVHLLTHLPQSVLNWGPLWTHNAFCYEDFNQELLKYVQSSQAVPLQICDTFRLRYVIKKLESICDPVLTYSQKKYLAQIFHKKMRPKPTLCVDNIYMLGKKLEIIEVPRSYILALQRIYVNVEIDTIIEYYQRILINNEIIHSKKYKKPQKRRSYYVLLNNNEIFQIELFLVLKKQNFDECYAIGYYFIKQPNVTLVSNVKLQHLILLQKLDNNLAAIRIKDIKEKVTIIKIKNVIIACVHPNHCELLT